MVQVKEKDVLEKIKEFERTLPKFEDGRINYSGTKYAPVVLIFIMYDGKILLLKRSGKVRTYQGKWNTVAGYLDEMHPIKEKVLEELSEEIDVHEDNIGSIKLADAHEE